MKGNEYTFSGGNSNLCDSVDKDATLLCFPGRGVTLIEPAHEKKDIMVFRFVILQMRMHNPQFGLQTCVVV